MKELLRVNDLTIAFKTHKRLLTVVVGASFKLYEGECLAIVGESGSGKSTLAKAIIGLNPPDVTQIQSGEIIYKGHELSKLSEKELLKYRGKEIAMIFQDSAASLNPTMKVGAQVLEAYLAHHKELTKEEAFQKVLELFDWVGISEGEKKYHLYPHELSGGMKQRIMIAIALAAEPKILIADEPTTSLDVTIQAQILDLFKRIQEKLRMSIIFITHDLSLVSLFATEILVMYNGSIIESRATSALFSNPLHPYTKNLIKSIPSPLLTKDDVLVPIAGSPPAPFEIIQGCSFHPRCTECLSVCKVKKPTLTTLSKQDKVACWLYQEEEALV